MYEILAMSGRYIIFFIAIMIFLNILLLSKGSNKEEVTIKVAEEEADKINNHFNNQSKYEDVPEIIGKLKVKSLVGKNTNKAYSVDIDLSKDVTIGRVDGNQVILLDPSVSKNHAVIYSKSSKYYIEDLNSTNGTYVNGKRIKKAFKIDEHSKIQIGSNEITIKFI